MEKALRYEINKRILELNNKIYPTNAPEGIVAPYLVYARISTKNLKTFEGVQSEGSFSFMFSIMAKRYSEMKDIVEKVENMLNSLPETEIGGAKKIFIKDLNINNINDTYESELKMERGVIDFTIFY